MFKISSSDNAMSALPENNISNEDVLSQAMILEFQGKYDEASGLYKQVFSSELNTTLGRYALRKLHEGYLCSNKKMDFDDYVNKSVRTKISKNDELSALLIDFENQELFANKNYDAMIKNLIGMLKDYKNIEPIYKQALFNLGLMYLNTLNDRSKATQYFSQLETEFPKDMLIVNAHYQLEKDAGLSPNLNLSENISEEKNSTDTSQAQILQEDKLLAIYPNPFNPGTVVNYQLSAISDVSIKVYDILGREVATLVDGMKEAGYYTAHFDGSKLASGVYFTRFVVKPQNSRTLIVQVKKMLLTK
jgi:tetratricopeptide (TPR) repeat protein